MRSMFNHNVHEGNLEAMVHGYKDGLLRPEEYGNLCQCDTLYDVKSQLQVTDYGNFLQQDGTLTSRILVDRAQEVLMRQFLELREWAEPPLSQFLDFICYEHMISNVLKLIIAKRSGRENMELLTKCHPMGVFPELMTLVAATDVREMFELILIDSPIGRFFNPESNHVRDVDELSVEFIRGMLLKNYYEQFYDFCCEMGGLTAEVMCPLIEFEADRASITIVANTCGVQEVQASDRRRLFPNLGLLADAHDELAEVENEDQLKEKLRRFPDFAELFDDSKSMEGSRKKSLEKRFVERSVSLYRDALCRQFQYGVFYAWVKLKELEVNNLRWIADCIVQGMKGRVHEYVPITV